MKDRDVINAFIAHLRKVGHSNLQVDRWPEDENSASPDIDAIANPFAIEHTSIDSIPSQRRDSDWFMQVAGGLEKELSIEFPFRLNITLEYDAVTKGQDWAAIRQALKSWITKEAPRLADGRRVLDGIRDVPVRLHVEKACDRPPGVFFGRFKPGDDTLSNRILDQFERKAKKLAKYQSNSLTTVLLVENYDPALMNKWKMLHAIREACPVGLPSGVDKIWYADTSIPNEIEFSDFTSDLCEERRPTSHSSGR